MGINRNQRNIWMNPVRVWRSLFWYGIFNYLKLFKLSCCLQRILRFACFLYFWCLTWFDVGKLAELRTPWKEFENWTFYFARNMRNRSIAWLDCLQPGFWRFVNYFMINRSIELRIYASVRFRDCLLICNRDSLYFIDRRGSDANTIENLWLLSVWDIVNRLRFRMDIIGT